MDSWSFKKKVKFSAGKNYSFK